MIWLTFFVCSIALLSICDLGTEKQKKMAVVLSGILMSLTAGLRNVGGLGADYDIYMDHYNGAWAYGGHFDGYFEIGYCAIAWFFHQCGISYNFFVFILTSISIYFLLLIIYKRSQLPMFSIMLYLSTYFLFYNMVLLRQMVAVVAFVYCLYAIIDGNKKSFIFSFLIGCLFHYSIVVLLFAYFVLRYWKINGKTVCALFCLGVLLKIVGIESVLSAMLSVEGEFLVSRTEDYLGNNDFSLNPLEYAKMLVFIILIVSNYKKVKDSTEMQVLLKSYMFFCIVIMAFGHIEIFFRIAMYFDLASLFFVPYIFNKISMTTSTRVFCYCFLSFFTIFAFLYRALNFNEGEFLAYKFYFL